MRHSYNKYRHKKRNIQHKYKEWGFKDPLYQIDKKFGYSKISPNGFYTLTFVDPFKLRTYVSYLDVDYENYLYTNWKDICADENNYYSLTNLIEEVKRNKPTISKAGYDHVVDADSDAIIDTTTSPDKMRRAVMKIVQDSLKKQEQEEQEQEAKSKPEGYDPGLFYEVEKGN
tara:strand:- start:1 stop:516 length:516 start_codon:yes stop_codon:yes gene_type:complete